MCDGPSRRNKLGQYKKRSNGQCDCENLLRVCASYPSKHGPLQSWSSKNKARPPLDSGCDRHHKICDWYRVRAMPPGRVHRDQSYSAARRCVRLKSTRCPLLAQSRHDRCPPAMRRPSGFIAPCLPSKVSQPPSGPLWVHEIKRDRYGTRAPHLKESLSCH